MGVQGYLLIIGNYFSMKTQEYFDKLKAELSSYPQLAALTTDVSNAQELLIKLTTDSPVALYDLMTWIQATGCAETGAEVENTQNVINREMRAQKYASFPWYVETSKKFQLGDTVEWLNGQFYYPIIDLTKRVIKQAAAVPITQGVRLKVAALDGGELAPVEPDVLAAFIDFWQNQGIGVKPPGVHLVITTNIPDLIKMSVRVKRNPQVLAANGSLLSNPAVFPVEDAIRQYIQYLPFNGVWNRSEQEDKIQEAQGVVDIEIDEAFSKYGSFPWQLIDMEYQADAGYMKIDPDTPLNTSIQYLL